MLLHKTLQTKIQSVNEEEFSIDFVFSTSDVDRHGEIIDQKGWLLDEFMKNPVVLFAHDQWTPAVGQVTKIGFDGEGNLTGTVKFAVEENPFAKILFNLYKNGFMRAVSVGFMNEEYNYSETDDQLTYIKNVLYELSLVNVPANARALAKQKGIDLSALEYKEKELLDKSMQHQLSEESIDKITNGISHQIKKILSADTAPKKIKKVETPKAKGGSLKVREINKAVRRLLKKKHSLNS